MEADMSVDTEFAEKTVISIDEPKQWKVLIMNDDVTTMEVVTYLLVHVFNHTEPQAKEIMLKVHNEGAGVAGVYSFEIAEQKSADATLFARANGAPLVIKIEEDN